MNDTKNLSPIDTSYLHKFSNVRIGFSCQCRYTTFGVQKISMQDSSLTISYASSNNGNFLFWADRNCFQPYITGFIGYVSFSGNDLDSGSYKDSTGTEVPGPMHGWLITGHERTIRFQNLPLLTQNSDSMVFLAYGKNLLHYIKQVQDSNYGFGSTILPPEGSPEGIRLDTVYWDKQPSPFLRVTLYK